ncbi:MAG: alpha/beta hydrolase [Solirubrobacteraceae bacterium]|jgi:pimeloyl-ACP methyl ester carboxylesterase|nr:alpha/beta hydrolase [Solirubrobacteraceae bacterium]
MRPFPEIPGLNVEHDFVTARGLRFHVAQAGAGEPLVLLHGWPQHWWAWAKVLPALAAEHRVICPDLRGLGWSEAPPGGYDKRELAADVLALLDALGLERVRLMGHDWGGWAGFLLAARAPERIRQYVALNIAPPWTGPETSAAGSLRDAWRFWYQVVNASPLVGSQVIRREAVVAGVLRADNVHPEAFSEEDVRIFAAPFREPARARASQRYYRTFLLRELPAVLKGTYEPRPLTVPTLLLHGERDVVIPPDMVRAGMREGDHLEVEFVPDSGHWIAQERPDLVAERALWWFREADYAG